MNNLSRSILELVANLSHHDQKKVKDFIQSLTIKERQKEEVKLRQDWAGALEKFKDKYTSLELQKKAIEWRGD